MRVRLQAFMVGKLSQAHGGVKYEFLWDYWDEVDETSQFGFHQFLNALVRKILLPQILCLEAHQPTKHLFKCTASWILRRGWGKRLFKLKWMTSFRVSRIHLCISLVKHHVYAVLLKDTFDSAQLSLRNFECTQFQNWRTKYEPL